jgi:hypothetical protein
MVSHVTRNEDNSFSPSKVKSDHPVEDLFREGYSGGDFIQVIDDPNSLENQKRFQSDLLHSHSVTVPKTLSILSQSKLKQFDLELMSYSIQCPVSCQKSLRTMVSQSVKQMIQLKFKISPDDMLKISSIDLYRYLFLYFGSRDLSQTNKRLKGLKMAAPGNQIDYITYNDMFNFELKCCGIEFQIPDRELWKIYAHGLAPTRLVQRTKDRYPTGLREAQLYAYEEVCYLEAVVEEAAYCHPVKSSNPLSPAAKPPFVKSNNDDKQKVSVKDRPEKEDKATWLKKQDCYYCLKMGFPSKGHLKNTCDKWIQAGKPAVQHPPAALKQFTAATAIIPDVRPPVIYELDVESTNSISFSGDKLFRVPGELVSSLGTVQVSVLFDSGSNLDTISLAKVTELIQLGVQCDIISNAPLNIKLAADKHVVVSNDTVVLDLLLHTPGHHVQTRLTFLVLKQSSEDVSLSFPTMSNLSLHGLMDNISFGESVDSPEDSMLFSLEQFVNEVQLTSTMSQAVDAVLTGAEVDLDTVQPLIVSESAPQDMDLMTLEICPAFSAAIELREIIAAHASVIFSPFDTIGMLVEPMEIKLKPGGIMKTLPCRFHNTVVLKRLKREILRMLLLGIIEVTDTAHGASPLVVVPKAGDEIRVAVDYQYLNSQIEDTASTIPNMKSLIPSVSNHKFYAKMDNLSGFWQLPLADSARDFSTIVTPFGCYRFTRCPFGIKTAPGIYQHRMQNVVLHGLIGVSCVVYIDDIVVWGDTIEEFLRNLNAVLARLSQFNVKLKPSKCSFGYSSVTFCGYVFDSSGYHLSDDRKQGISSMKAPSSLKQLRSFLGMINFFRDFIPKLSEVCVPLTDLTKSSTGKPFVWSDEAELAFIHVKNLILESGSLQTLDDEGPIILFTDASNLGCGACLIQKQGVEQLASPIVYLSHKFSSTAQNWSVIEQECFAIFYAITMLSSYLYGRHFTVATDHRNLVYLFKSTIPKLVRWRLALMEFQFTVMHIAGIDNVVADGLSRLFQLVKVDDKEIQVEDLLRSVHNTTTGHPSVTALMASFKAWKIEWDTMENDIKQYVHSCPSCQLVRHRRVPLVDSGFHTLMGSYPMKQVSVDVVGPFPVDEIGNCYYLSIVCHFSHFDMLIPTKSTTAIEYVRALIVWIGLFGIMKELRTDGGSQFTADVSQQLAVMLGYQHLVILPYHPQANGINERRHKEELKILKFWTLDTRLKQFWSMILPFVQRILNSTYDSSIGTYPSKIIFGDLVPVNFPLKFVSDVPIQTTNDYLKTLQSLQAQILSKAQAFIDHRRSHLLEKYQISLRGKKVHQYSAGDYVVVTYPVRAPSKLMPTYRGPFLILELTRPDMVLCLDLVTNNRITYHVDRLLPFVLRPEVSQADLVDIAAYQVDEERVKAVKGYRLREDGKKGRGPSRYEYLIEWEDGSEKWKIYSDIKDLQLLDQFGIDHPDLGL